jgi:hypothetical protein
MRRQDWRTPVVDLLSKQQGSLCRRLRGFGGFDASQG